MSLYKRGGVWWYRFKFCGQEIRESTKSSNKNVARDAECARRAELGRGYNQLRKRQAPILFSAAAQNWKETKSPHWRPRTIELCELSLRHLNPIFGKKLLTDISADDIARYQLARQRDGPRLAPSTLR